VIDQMTGIADKIMKRARAHGRGKWACTPRDFLDLGSRAAVDQALTRLVKAGELRRVGRGLYDLPRISRTLNRSAPTSLDSVVAAVARRDNIRVMPDGIIAANRLGLTNAVPAKADYVTDGATRTIKVDGWTVRLRHARPNLMNWLGPRAAGDPQTVAVLQRRLPDNVKRDLAKGANTHPDWAARVVGKVVHSDSAVV
jgi:hypothetical protein